MKKELKILPDLFWRRKNYIPKVLGSHFKSQLITIVFIISLFVCFISCGAGSSVTLDNIFKNDLDTDLKEKFELSRQIALEWQSDARLHKVRLNLDESGDIAWKFHWISNSEKKFMELFSSAPSFRFKSIDPGAEQKTELKINSTIGFNKVGMILQKKGVDLKTLKPEDIMHFKLIYEKRKEPKAYYYYIFLKNGSQYYIHAETGEFKK